MSDSGIRDVPDYGAMLPRPRLMTWLDSAGRRRPVVITAPSGWGKSVLASQYASSFNGECHWIDAHGRLAHMLSVGTGKASSGDGTVTRTASLYELLVSCEAPTLVVIDEVTDADLDSAKEIVEVCARRRRNVRFILCGRNIARPFFSRGTHPLVLTRDDLALTDDEAADLQQTLMRTREDNDFALMNQLAGGHPALFCILGRVGARSSAAMATKDVGAIIGNLIVGSVPDGELPIVAAAALLKTGQASDLSPWPIDQVESTLLSVGDAVPLVSVTKCNAGGSLHFHFHDYAEAGALETAVMSDESVAEALDRLEACGRFHRAVELIERFKEPNQKAQWLASNCERMLDEGFSGRLLDCLNGIHLHIVMDHPRLLVAWSDALREQGRACEAVSKARACINLASYSPDAVLISRARLALLQSLKHESRLSEACVQADLLVGDAIERLPLDLQSQILTECGGLYCTLGRMSEATAVADAAIIRGSQSGVRCGQRARGLRALLFGLKSGDFAAMSTALIREIDDHIGMLDIAELRGNLTIALLEMGRLRHGEEMLRSLDFELPAYHSMALEPIRGMAQVAKGNVDSGLELVARGLSLALSTGNVPDVAIDGVYEAVMLRASGRTEDGLASAERSVGLLTEHDYYGFRRLAALEVAASLVALGDVAAGRRWAENAMTSGFEGNAYHALRAAMILAECDRREGNLADGVARLAAHRGHIASESSNWQMAMYVRAFPDLLGMLASATGVDALPIHMLKMVLPEFGELGLRCAKTWMDPGEWRSLGLRVLGEAELARLERRQGEPICRVRLFGGLDVAVGDRMIGERDWKKRKARLLFAMLVAQRGQDLSRDQILEHLWPEMPDENARNNFYVAWSAMKSALVGRSGSCAYLENTGGRCRIVADAVRSDIDEFEEALAEAREAEGRSDRSSALEAYSRLMTVYRGDLLPADIYDDWFSMLRDRYRLEFVDAMLRAAQILLEQDDPCEALVYSRRALGIDPLREDLYQATLRCHIAAGQRSGAIDTFLQCKMRLVEDLGLDPSAETMSLYQEILVMEDCPRYDDYGLS